MTSASPMPAYYAFYSWREGRFVKMYVCQPDYNLEKACYCLVDTVEEILDFMEVVVGIVKRVERVENDSGTVFGTTQHENYFSNWNKATDKRGLVTDFLAKAGARSRVHHLNAGSSRARRWSPSPPGSCPGDFVFPELFEDVDST
ncbi:hypothetical protein [Mollivirus kamchatka]|nr:hypothetical protein [Mollivirus kamchatka]